MALSSSDLSAIYGLLQNALSQDEAVRKRAEATLAACENRPGFCSLLLEIIAANDLDDQNSARWLASVYFKNSINRYWRIKRDSPGISEAEKPYLRSKLLELIREESNQVAVQLALLISKIARFDYPKEWPELFPSLIQKIQSADALTTQRVYMVLSQVLKELSTKRLAVDQRNFAEITSQLFDYTWHHWHNDTQVLLKEFSSFMSNPEGHLSLSESGQVLQLTCERWIFCLKALRRMLKFGFPSDAKSVQEVSPVKQVSPHFLQVIQLLLGYRAALPQGHPYRVFHEKGCLKLLKTLFEVQTTHPYSFSDRTVLPPVLDFCYRMVTEPQSYGDAFEQFLIQCMVFIQTVIQCKEYKAAATGRVLGNTIATLEETKGNLAKKADEILKSLLDNKRVLLLCDILVRRYFILTASDLEEWAHDPESFHHEQDMVQWKDKLRPCAESLYLTLFENYRETLAPLVIQNLKQTSDDCPPAAMDADVEITEKLLLKEAAYSAVGIANDDLYDLIDFESWYKGVLAQDISNRQPNGRILRRRVAWLLGQWVSKIVGDIRQPVYMDLLRLLGDGDLAVQLAACRSLQHLIDDIHFYDKDFVGYVPTCLELLFQFMNSAHEFDSKLQVFNLVSLVIDRLGEKILPCTQSLISFLPQVWQESEGQSLLRIQVMVALQQLLGALGPQSPVCYDLLFPILDYSTNINQPDELNMLEDGLQLWQTTLKHAPSMAPQLLDLFPYLVPIMERNSDHLQIAMKIIESYILLDGADFLRPHSGSVVKILDAVVGNVKEKGMMCTLPVIDILIQCFPADAPALLDRILQKLLIIVVNGIDEADIVRASAGAVLARVLVQNSSFFAHWTSQPSLLIGLGNKNTGTGQSVLFMFFDAWLDKVDSLTTFSKKKICALALCILLTLREPQVLDRLEPVLSVCTSMLHQTEEDQNGAPLGYDYLPSNMQSEEDASRDSTESEDTRRRRTLTADPINKLSTAALLRENLQICSSLHGEAAFNAALSRLHPSLLRQLQQLLGR